MPLNNTIKNWPNQRVNLTGRGAAALTAGFVGYAMKPRNME